MIASSRSSILLLLIAVISSAPGSSDAYNIGHIGTIISRTFSSSASQSQLQSSTRTATRSNKINSSTIRIRKTAEEEQDNVDTYLDFLDKRYRRVHARQQIQNQQNTQQQQQQKSTASQPFSAMEWLLSGRTTPVASNSESSTETAATIIPGLLPENEEEDALYVLGVAGLASQKYLQAHKSYLSYLKKNKPKPPLENIDGSPLVMESENDYATQQKKRSAALTMKVLLVGKVLVPVLRVLYAIDRQKQFVKAFVQMQVTTTVHRVLTYNRPVTQSVVPSITKLLFGSGTTWKRNNLVRTISFGYATLMFFRYYLWNSTATL